MDMRRLKRAVLIGVVATVVVLGLGVVAVVLNLVPSGGRRRDVTVDLEVVTDTPDYYWAPVYVPGPLTPDEYKGTAKFIGDEHFRGRFGQAQVFDDEWAHDMELPENQHIQLSAEEEARWVEHQVMAYVHDAKGYWFDCWPPLPAGRVRGLPARCAGFCSPGSEASQRTAD